MKKFLRNIAALAGVAWVGVASANISFAPYDPIITSNGNIVPGEWNNSLEKGQAYADANNVPMLVIGGSATCGHCHDMQTACNTDEFKAWADQKKIVMIYGTDSDIKAFCRTPNKDLTSLPLISIYWKKADGTLIWKSFSGLDGQMLSKVGDTLQAQLINSCDLYIGGYPQMTGYEYLAFTSNEADARLEAEAGFTAYVDVPLIRDSFMSGYVSTNRITAAYSGALIVDDTVVWAASDIEMSYRINIPGQAAVGDEIVVTLYAQDGEERGSVKIFVVEPRENSPKNPLFVGERTVATLGYGEWTMDLDVAMKKYAAEPESKLLVLVGGSLWCPDCVMTDHFLLDREEFREWALANNVILVDIDIPNNPNAPEGSACLLTRVVAKASDNYRSGRGTIVDEADYEAAYQSGAGYLSRHMVSDEDAAAIYERNRKLVGTNWANGGWNNPTRANQNRTGVPVFYSLTRKGELAGCLDTFSSVAPSEFNPAYLTRLEELLALADGAAALTDNAWQTTTKTYDGTAASGFTGTLTAVDLSDTIALDELDVAAVTQTLTVKGSDSTVTVTVNLISVSGTNVTTVATAKGKLSDGIVLSGTMTKKEAYYVQVVGTSAGSLDVASPSANTTVTYKVTGTRELISNPFSNPWITKVSRATLPLYAPGGSSLAGFMELQTKKNGKVSVKISSAKKRIASVSGAWDNDIAADGTATATLAKNGVAVALEMSSEGEVTASVTGVGAGTLTSGECTLSADYGDFSGTYVVALPLVDDSGIYSGEAYMTLTMGYDKSSKERGKMKYKVFLPDGKKLSGTTGVTIRDANFGVVPVAKTSGVNTFTAALKIRRKAGSTATRRAVVAVDGIKAEWSNNGVVNECGVYGSYINRSESLIELSGVESLTFVFDSAGIAQSGKYGTLISALYDDGAMKVSGSTIAPAESVKGFTFKLDRATGVFQGKTVFAFTGKAKVSAKFTGVILPDWYSDCQCQEDGDSVIPLRFMPFGVGQCIFRDVVGGKTVKRSIAVTME